MYDIWFYYKGNETIRAKSVQKVTYISEDKNMEVTLTEDAILANQLPCTSELFLICENRSYSMSCKDLLAICVKEKPKRMGKGLGGLF